MIQKTTITNKRKKYKKYVLYIIFGAFTVGIVVYKSLKSKNSEELEKKDSNIINKGINKNVYGRVFNDTEQDEFYVVDNIEEDFNEYIECNEEDYDDSDENWFDPDDKYSGETYGAFLERTGLPDTEQNYQLFKMDYPEEDFY